MKLIRLITALLALSLTGHVMAHGGEDHGDESAAAVSSVATDQAGLIVHETSTDAVELVLKHPVLEKGKSTLWKIFLVDPVTNRLLADEKVELSFSELPELNVIFAPVKVHPGVYEAHVALPKAGSFNAIISVGGVVRDLLSLGGIEIKKEKTHDRALQNAPLASSANTSNNTSHQLTLAKESQFLLGIETAVARRETVKNAIRAFGKITHRATGEQDILAPTSGRLKLSSSNLIPIAGQAVKKGDVLGEIETIGALPLRAPFDGVVAFSEFHPGQWVEAGTLLFKVTDPSVVWVESRLFEKDIAPLSPGARATITVESLPNQSFEGTILAIGKAFDETSRSMPVTIEVQNPQGLLKVGQWAKVFLEISTSTEAIAVPKSALLMREGVPVVFVKRSAEVFEGRPVHVMNEYIDTIYLSSGIVDGEKVVIKGNYQLLPFLRTLVPATLVPGGGR